MQGPKDFLGQEFWKRATFGPMAKAAETDADLRAITRRLVTLRHYIAGDNQTRFAAEIGIEVKRWNNFERGSPLSKEVAILLVRKVPGLTLDWLYLGIEDGLPIQLQRELTAAGNKATSASRRG